MEIKNWDGGNIDVGILGVPFDFGVKLSGGRPGATQAPDTIRAQIKRYGNAPALTMADFGNVATVAEESDKTHTNITDAVQDAFRYANTLIVLGGGNDISYASIRALSEIHNGSIGGMNVDAHFDVREVRENKITSGTPYRMLQDRKYLAGKSFFEVAAQRHVNSLAHETWLQEQGAHIYFLSDVREQGIEQILKEFNEVTKKQDAIFVSIDIDSVAQAFAPGSSAPNSDGLMPQDVLSLARFAGENPRVRLFEIMEVNPRYDIDERTSRLAATIIIGFLFGYAKRSS